MDDTVEMLAMERSVERDMIRKINLLERETSVRIAKPAGSSRSRSPLRSA
jgi:hypothetical protein